MRRPPPDLALRRVSSVAATTATPRRRSRWFRVARWCGQSPRLLYCPRCLGLTGARGGSKMWFPRISWEFGASEARASPSSVASKPMLQGRLAQLARAPARHAGGRRFKSCNAQFWTAQTIADRRERLPAEITAAASGSSRRREVNRRRRAHADRSLAAQRAAR